MTFNSRQYLQQLFFFCCLLVCFMLIYLNGNWEVKPSVLVKPAAHHKLFPSNWTLINLSRFSFLLNSDICGKDSVDLLICVTSHVSHVDLRNSFRRGLPSDVLAKFHIRRLFILAQSNENQKDYQHIHQSIIENEHILYRDIIQGDFFESYRNLSYKHILGLQYAVHFCPQAKFILKMDDDIAVDVFQFLDVLKTTHLKHSLAIIGSLMENDDLKPQRNQASKWFVSYEDYPFSTYPPFVSGWAYATTIPTAQQLVQHSQTSPFFWIDDVYVTGLLANLTGVQYINIKSKLTVYTDHLKCCVNKPSLLCNYIIGPTSEPTFLQQFCQFCLHCFIH